MLNPQGDSIWRRGLWEVIRSHDWSPHDGTSRSYKKRLEREALSLGHLRIQWGDGCLQAKKQALTRQWICW